ncbi:MAG: choice-of-anchor Q domain-containing protein [bacterium]|nr:choice-of-anchor Q domain-containing protein [bacterium]
MKSLIFSVALVCFPICLPISSPSLAATRYVDGSVSASGDGMSWDSAFKTIQEGIDAASDGETVIIAERIYVERVRFYGKDVVLRSTNPSDPATVAHTIIDGNQWGSAVTFSGTETEACVLSGFTIRNGNGESGAGICGGTPQKKTRATIKNNVITGNVATKYGGGLYCCDGTIDNNSISGNSALSGAGLYDCGGVVRGNLILGNTTAAPRGYGGGLSRCDGTVENNTVCSNTGTEGSGLYMCRGTILNCIVWGNTGGKQLLDCAEPTYCCIEHWSEGGEGNITYYPYFLDPFNGDYHLKTWSPCIDSGDPSSPYANEPEPNGDRVNVGVYGNTSEAATRSPDTDSDQLPDDWEMHFFRQLVPGANDDFDGDSIPNLEEYHRGLNPAVPAGLWYVSAAMAVSGDGSSWETALKTIQEGIDLASDGDTVIVGEGAYKDSIHFNGKDIVVQSTDPADPAVVAKTIIESDGGGTVATFAGTESEACVLSGFTIRKGATGIYGWGATGGPTHATIQNNVITNNSNDGLRDCCGIIQNNIISGNRGHGLYFCGGQVLENRISENGMGGLAYCHGAIRGNQIILNKATRGGGLEFCQGPIVNNTICRNSAEEGGGLYRCTGHIESNTIANNMARSGGGLSECTGTILNCIIWGNVAVEGPQLYKSSVPYYSCIQNCEGGGIGNISFYPHFVRPVAEDYHLQSWSPCIDAGDPASAFSNEPEPNGGRIDMGAYGNTAEAVPASLDFDQDLLPDYWEDHFLHRLDYRALDDPDGDGVSNLEEYHQGTNPLGPGIWYVRGTVASSGDGSSQKPFKTVKEGINASLDGDTVIVSPGTYFENIHFRGKNIRLTSSDPLDRYVVAATVLDGNKTGSVVTFLGTENATCVFEGFTIRSGMTMSGCGAGILGATWDAQTRATIRNNVITGNAVYGSDPNGYGGGIAFCDGLIQRNTITNNHATAGGGLYDCDGIIDNNKISTNQSDYGGGGLLGCDGVIRNNVISHNSGGGASDCDGDILNNAIVLNSAGVAGGGGLYECDGTVQNNTIAGNHSTGEGGGLAFCAGTIRNCIIWDNWTDRESQQLFSCNAPSFSCIQGWPHRSQGNINQDPLFQQKGDDYRLQPVSPCIDAGVNFYWAVWPQHDLDGLCRLAGERVDMGCYEYAAGADTDGDLLSNVDEAEAGTDPEHEDTDGDGLRDGLETLRRSDPLVSTSPEIVEVPPDADTIQEALCLAIDGDEIVVAPGEYQEILGFCGADVVLRSWIPELPDSVDSTVLDGAGMGPVVCFLGSESGACVLSGFTITGGSGTNGGGISGGTEASHTHAAITNNAIKGNSAKHYGGGLAYCDGVILNNEIFENSSGRAGGGLFACDGVISDNLISRNSTDRYMDGGGLALCQGSIRNNIITENTAGHDGGGLYECGGAISGNVISRNSAGGLCGCDGPILNNVICDNKGNGLTSCQGAIENNTVSWNSTGISGCKGVIRNCIVWGNTSYRGQLYDSSVPSYSCVENWRGGGPGNIADYPHFMDAGEGDYHLSSWSPCVDAGDPSSPYANEPEPNGGRIDMGAYGNTSEATSRSLDTDHDGLPDDWEMELFGTLVQGGADDPDKDLVSNLLEYRWGHNPTASPAWYVDGSSPSSGDGTSWSEALKTIQEGIDLALDGDTVVVAQGIYLENVQFKGRNIVLRSIDPSNPSSAANTIIDGNNVGPVVVFPGDENETCVLAGFTIRNGQPGSIDGYEAGAGGICTLSSRKSLATIRNNIITANYQGAIVSCDGLITDNVIAGNSAGKLASGIAYCDGLIENNVITANTGGRRGMIYECHGIIQNNIITGNTLEYGNGAGIASCHGVVQNNLIADNSAKYGGGLSECNGVIQNNSIIGNQALEDGGGLYGCSGQIRNCIIWGNEAGGLGDQVYESNVPSYCCIEEWQELKTPGTGNINQEPLFIDREGADYRLQRGSPCIDAGVNFYWFAWPQKDLDGNCRLSGGRVDIGCYEYGSYADSDGDLFPDDSELVSKTDWNNADSDGDGLRDGLEILRGSDPLCPTPPRRVHVPSEATTIQEGLCLSVKDDEIIVAPGTYRGTLRFCGTDVVLRSSWPEEGTGPSPTILDGEGQGPVVCFTGAESENCVLSGFTIRNGSAVYGGGICGGTSLQHSRATIERSVVTANSARESGGGIAYCDGIIRNTLIHGNSAEKGGGGLAYCRASILNSTIAWNEAPYPGGEVIGFAGRIHNSVVWPRAGTKYPGELPGSSTYSCVPADKGGFGEGSFFADPQFLHPESGDFRLLPNSPCIDAGSNDPELPDTDAVGMHRIMFGGKSLTVDMGACEFYVNKLEPAPGTNEAVFTWSSLADRTYSIFYTDDLFNWHTAIANLPSSGNQTTSWLDDGSLTGLPPLLAPKRFYRILENP